jgi:RHS repeat-associated protein/fimbrial isopeptide formation D2 family protein/uncharacterized repeat protein (TIGR01451 family)
LVISVRFILFHRRQSEVKVMSRSLFSRLRRQLHTFCRSVVHQPKKFSRILSRFLNPSFVLARQFRPIGPELLEGRELPGSFLALSSMPPWDGSLPIRHPAMMPANESTLTHWLPSSNTPKPTENGIVLPSAEPSNSRLSGGKPTASEDSPSRRQDDDWFGNRVGWNAGSGSIQISAPDLSPKPSSGDEGLSLRAPSGSAFDGSSPSIATLDAARPAEIPFRINDSASEPSSSSSQPQSAMGAAPVPVVTIAAPAEVRVGERFDFTINFDNTSTSATGFAPYWDLILPATGKDGAGAAVDDGITFVEAKFFGATLPAAQVFTATFDSAGQATHPFAVDNLGKPVIVTGTAGDQFVSVRLPFDAVAPDQPLIPVTVTALVSNQADVNQALTLQARGGFARGADAADNPTVDAIVVQSPFVTASVTPTLFTLNAGLVSGGDEVPTGINYPRQIRVTADISDGQTVTDLDFTAALPANLQYVSLDSTKAGGVTVSTTATSTPSLTVPGGTLTRRFTTVAGTTSTSDAEMIFTVYAPRLDGSSIPVLDPLTGASKVTAIDAKTSGKWVPIDTRDGPGPITVSSDLRPDDVSLTLRSLAAQQSVAVAVEKAGSATGATPGDVLEYTITSQVSDYFAFNNLKLSEIISDGQRFDASFTPRLAVNGNGFTMAAANFSATNFTVTNKFSAGDGVATDGTDGTTALEFRVANEIASRGQATGKMLGGLVKTDGTGFLTGTGDGASTVTVTFRSIVQEDYTDAFPAANKTVKQGDSLSANGLVFGDVLSNSTFVATGNQVTDDHATSIVVPRSDLTTSIYAVNGTTTLPAVLAAGDTVTYRIRYDLRSGDVQNVNLNDYLPAVFNAGTVTTFDYATASASAPAVGTLRRGPADTFRGLYPTITPTLATNTLNGNNSLSVNYGTLTDTQSRPSVIELLFTVAVSTNPTQDGIPITNWVRSNEQNTPAAFHTQDRISQMVLSQPAVRIRKGVIGSSNAAGVFTPSTVGPSGVTLAAPGTTTTPFTGVIHSGNLGSTLDSNLGNVDAGDLVRFAVVVENTGRGRNGAFDVRLQDAIPTGFAIPVGGGGANLSVRDGSGAVMAFTDLGGGYFGSGIELSDPGPTTTFPGSLDPGRDPATNAQVTTGRNLAVITYDLVANDTVSPRQVAASNATLLKYAAAEGGPNFATLVDEASITIAQPAITRTLTASNQTFTTGTQLAIGEIGTYEVKVTVPEGASPTAKLVETLPAGLAFVSLESLTTSSGLTTSKTDFVTVLQNAKNALTTASSPATATTGRTVTLDFGTLTNANRVNTTPEIVTLVTKVAAINVSGSNRGTNLVSSSDFQWTNPTAQSLSQNASATTVTPGLTVGVSPNPTTVDAGDTVTYTVTIANPTATNAVTGYEAVLNYPLPAKMTIVGSPTASTGTNLIVPDAGTLLFTGGAIKANFATFDTNKSSVITFQAKVVDDVAAEESISSSATVTWTSLPGVVNVTQSTWNSVAVERTGNTADLGGAANNFLATGAGAISVAKPTVALTILGTNQTHTTGNDLVIGETVQYRIRTTIPEGKTNSVSLTDSLPSGLAIVSLDALTASAAVSTSIVGGFPQVLTNARNALASPGSSALATFGTLTNSDRVNTTAEEIVVDLTAVLLNTTGNQAGITLANAATLSYSNSVSTKTVSATAPLVTVREPGLTITAVPSTSAVDARETVTYTVTVANPTGGIQAFEPNLSVPLPTNLTFVAGSIVQISGVAPIGGSPTFASNTISANYTSLLATETSSFKFQAKVADAATPGTAVNTPATVKWTSLPGTPGTLSTYNTASGERIGVVSDPLNDYLTTANASVTVNASTLAGFVYNDANGSAVRDAGDTGISGTTVILSGTDHLSVAVSKTVTTDATGAYSFPLLRAGTYTIQENQPAGWFDGPESVGTPALGAVVQANDKLGTYTIALGTSANSINNNFAEGQAKLSGVVFLDADWNGARGSVLSEPGLGGVIITMTPVGAGIVRVATTASDGTYAFSGVPAGDYVVTQTQPSGYTSTTPDTLRVYLPAAERTAADFGEMKAIDGWVFGQTGGSTTKKGSWTVSPSQFSLVEGDSFTVWAERPIVIPNNPSSLTIQYSALNFDLFNRSAINDAFEIAVVDSAGRPVAGSHDLRRDSFVNFTEEMTSATAQAARTATGSVTLDLSNVTPGAKATLRIRLVNNDVVLVGPDLKDITSTVTINGFSLNSATAPKFFVADDAANASFRYAADGMYLNQSAITVPASPTPRGIATNATGTRTWVVDRAGTVSMTDATGFLIGSWQATDAQRPEDITTNGTDIWLVDAEQKRVLRYAGGAAQLSGSLTATSSFALNSANTDPTGIVTDGTTFWVTDRNSRSVFVYTLAGALDGQWTFENSLNSVTGITLDPTNATQDLWLVDRGSAKVYTYQNSRSRRSGADTYETSFALAAGNIGPEGIADPNSPPIGVFDEFWVQAGGGSLAFLQTKNSGPVSNSQPNGPIPVPVGGGGYLNQKKPGVLTNDTDLEKDPLTAVLGVNTKLGLLDFRTDGSFTYQVTSGKAGDSDTFTYQAKDAISFSNSTQVKINIIDSNPPVALEDIYTVSAKSTTLNVNGSLPSLIGVLGNDTDADPGSSISAQLIRGPEQGTLTFNGDGTFVYVVNDTFFGLDRFYYRAVDEKGHKSTYTEVILDSRGRAIDIDVTPDDWAKSIVRDTSWVVGSQWLNRPQLSGGGDAPTAAVARGKIIDFAIHGPTFGILSSGDARGVNKAGTFSSYSFNGGTPQTPVNRGNSAFDVTTIKIDLAVPADAGYVALDLRFMSEEFPQWVGTGYNDSVILEWGQTTWSASGSTINAPDNFAIDADGKIISINNTGVAGMSPLYGIGTAFDGGLTPNSGNPYGNDTSGGATQLLRAYSPIPAGHAGTVRSLYISLFDQGDTVWDTAVFVDNLFFGTGSKNKGLESVITINASAPDTQFAEGSKVLITGKVESTDPVAAVFVNGVPVDAVDAAGNFFTLVTVGVGGNKFIFDGINTKEQKATTSLSLTGVAPGSDGFSSLSIVSKSLAAEYGRTSFDKATGTVFAEMAVTNTGQYRVDAPLYVGIRNISDPTVSVFEPDGLTPQGLPFFDYSKLIDTAQAVTVQNNGTLDSTERTAFRTITFTNPNGNRFNYDLVWFGQLNRPPLITTIPVIRGTASKAYSYDVDAVDPDGHAIAGYTLLSGPAGMTVDSNGLISWPAGQVSLGSYPVAVEVRDDRGAATTQKYVLVIGSALPNRPPQFTSTPSVTATLTQAYSYTVSAIDPDGDTVTFTTLGLPSWLTWNAATKSITGTPPASVFGQPQQIEFQASDPSGLLAVQRYLLTILPDPTNRDPQITSLPASTLVTAATPYSYAVTATDPDGDAITFSLDGITQQGMTINATTGLFQWTPTTTPTTPVSVTIRVRDPRGGTSTQRIELTGSVVTPNGSISGVIFEDTNSDGVQNAGETGVSGKSVYLDLNGNGQFDLGTEPAQISGLNGTYTFGGLSAGNYRTVAIPGQGRVPTLPVGGTKSVVVADGQAVSSIDFGVKLTSGSLVNRSPSFVTTPPSAGPRVNQTWRYESVAIDPDNDPVVYDVLSGPTGLTIQGTTGVVVWTPTLAQTGDQTAVIRARDNRGGFGTQTIRFSVPRPNTAPVITSTPNFTALLNRPYEYRVQAQDADGDTLAYSLINPPSGVTINSTTGVIAWALPSPAKTTFDVTYKVDDNRGGWVSETYTLTIVEPQLNRPPVIVSVPRDTTGVGQSFQYQVVATDADNDPLVYTLSFGAPNGMTMTSSGFVTWIPDASLAGQSFTYTVEVTDNLSPAKTQTNTLKVLANPPVNRAPVFGSSPTAQARVGKVYSYDVRATDPDNDPVSYILTKAPGGASLDAKTGQLRWTPDLSQVGKLAFEIVAVDPFGANDVQSFFVEVKNTNLPPQFVGSPNNVGVAGEVYSTPLKATDPDGDTLTYGLLSFPQGMTIDANTGLVRWSIPSNLGTQQVTVRVFVSDGQLSQDLEYKINVSATKINQPPVITSFAPTGKVAVNNLYQYNLKALDPDNDKLLYRIKSGAQAGMNFNSTTGVFTWTPTTAGTYTFALEAVEDPGTAGKLSATETVTLTVRANTAPYFVPPTPTTSAIKGVTVLHDARAKDDENDAFTFSVKSTALGSNISLNSQGRVSIDTSKLVVGTSYNWDLTVTDSYSASKTETYALLITADNVLPVVALKGTPNPVETGNAVTVQVTASDNVGLSSTKLEALIGGNWTVVSLGGTNSGSVTPTVAGKLELRATATDLSNNSATATGFVRVVNANDQNAPLANITSPAKGALVTASPMAIAGLVDDPEDNLVSWELEYKAEYADTWQRISVGDTEVPTAQTLGSLVISTLADGLYALRLTAKDAKYTTISGNSFRMTGGQATIVDDTDSTPPIVQITAPNAGMRVEELVDVLGIVDDPDNKLQFWRLEIAEAGSDSWRLIQTGTNEIVTAAKVGTIDPTGYANGNYTLRLRAVDQGGQESSTSRFVRIDSQSLKLGNMKIATTDLTIAVGGIPITVGRVYDSHKANQVGDFGFGWTVEIGGYTATVDKSTVNEIGQFRNGSRVQIRDASGLVSNFKFQAQPTDPFGFGPYYTPLFVPEDSWTTSNLDLASPGGLLLTKSINGTDWDIFDYRANALVPSNPALGLSYVVTEYSSGLETTMDGYTNQTTSIMDRNKNELRFNRQNGVLQEIVHGRSNAQNQFVPSGRSVQLVPDSQDSRRIAAVVDPRGNRIRYAYDAAGNLASVTDRSGRLMASYGYASNPAHYLTTVTDAQGTRALEAKYDTSTPANRLQELKDAANNTAQMGYTVNSTGTERAVQTVTLPGAGEGGSNVLSTVAFDKRGNVVRSVDPKNVQSLTTYSDTKYHPDLPTVTTQVVGAPGGGDDLITTMTYDVYDPDPNTSGPLRPTGNPSSITDPTGAVSTMSYNSLGLPVSVTDGNGNASTTSFDNKGNLTFTRSAEAVTSSMGYDTRGNLTSISRAGMTSSMNYDTIGQLQSATDPQGNLSESFYDLNGNREKSVRYWYSDPAGKNGKVALENKTEYDENDRVRFSYDERGNKTETIYDTMGRVLRSIDPRGVVTEAPTYNSRGLAIEAKSPDGTMTRTVYDKQGRETFTTDRYILGQSQPIRGTQTIYDNAGRVIRTERRDGVGISIATGTANMPESQVTTAGTLLSASETVYDDLGRTKSSIQFVNTPNAAKSEMVYDTKGRQTGSITYTDAAYTLSKAMQTQSEFDVGGRVIATIDSLGKRTESQYDGDSRVTKVTYADGAFMTTAYDSNGRRTGESMVVDWTGSGVNKTAVLQTTNYGYDTFGRMISILQPPVDHDNNAGTAMVRPETKFGFNAFGQQISITDANNRVTAFTYDKYGQQTSRTLPAVGGVSAKEEKFFTQYGELDYSIDFNGTKVDMVYDYEAGSGLNTKFGRVAKVTWTRSGQSVPEETQSHTYDPFGRLDVVTETKGAVTRVTDTDYDVEGRIVKITRPEGLIEYGYDQATSRHTKTWTAKSEWTYAHDVLGRLVSVADVPGGTSTFTTYNLIGNVETVTTKQGSTTLKATTNSYDSNRHWLVGVANKDAANSALSTFTYTRRADGQITQAVESVKQPSGTFESVTTLYTYDALNRLTKEAITVGSGDYAISYVMDMVGNRLQKIRTGAGAETTVSTFNERDQLVSEVTGSKTTTFAYDKNGSLTSQSQSGGGSTRTQSWDSRGRMSGATVDGVTTSYNYTPDGIRSSVTENGTKVDYIIDSMTPSGYAQVVEELASGVLGVRYTYGASLDPTTETRSGVTSIYLADGHSGVRQAINLLGAVILAQRFDAYGVSMAKTGSLVTPIGYRGERFDGTLGQYYLRARFYDPRQGRFTGMDPHMGNMRDPSQVMRYGYAGANPIGAMDPSGRMSLLGISVRIGIGFLGGITGSILGSRGGITGQIIGAVAGAALALLLFASGPAGWLAAAILLPRLYNGANRGMMTQSRGPIMWTPTPGMSAVLAKNQISTLRPSMLSGRWNVSIIASEGASADGLTHGGIRYQSLDVPGIVFQITADITGGDPDHVVFDDPVSVRTIAQITKTVTNPMILYPSGSGVICNCNAYAKIAWGAITNDSDWIENLSNDPLGNTIGIEQNISGKYNTSLVNAIRGKGGTIYNPTVPTATGY